MATSRKIVIAGAGLGGLCAAACLLKVGVDVDVYEQVGHLAEVGAGVQISANAGRVLRHLGLIKAVVAAGFCPEEYRFRDYLDGEVLQTIPLGESYRERHGVPYVSVHRADLHAALVDAVRAQKSEAIHTGARVTGYEEDSSGVTVRFADGNSTRCDALIGADGLKSLIRKTVVEPVEPEFTGDIVWRAMVPMDRLPAEYRTRAVDIWVGPGGHFVTYPIAGGKTMNFGGVCEYDKLEEESWTTRRPWSEMRADFEGWNSEVITVIDAAKRDDCYRWALMNRRPIDNWSTRRVTLLGDAAHPTLPYMAQGAAMAMEDAAVLARAFAQELEIPLALELYQRNRIGRTSRIVNESSANRRLFHLRTKEDLNREFAKREFEKERNAWVFSYDPMTVPLV